MKKKKGINSSRKGVLLGHRILRDFSKDYDKKTPIYFVGIITEYQPSENPSDLKDIFSSNEKNVKGSNKEPSDLSNGLYRIRYLDGDIDEVSPSDAYCGYDLYNTLHKQKVQSTDLTSFFKKNEYPNPNNFLMTDLLEEEKHYNECYDEIKPVTLVAPTDEVCNRGEVVLTEHGYVPALAYDENIMKRIHHPPPQSNTHSTSSHQQHPRHAVQQQQQQQTEQCSKEHQRGMIGPNDKWADVWNILRKQGWTYKAGSRNVGWYCIPPGGKAPKKNCPAIEGEDYFIDGKEQVYAMEQYGWRGDAVEPPVPKDFYLDADFNETWSQLRLHGWKFDDFSNTYFAPRKSSSSPGSGSRRRRGKEGEDFFKSKEEVVEFLKPFLKKSRSAKEPNDAKKEDCRNKKKRCFDQMSPEEAKEDKSSQSEGVGSCFYPIAQFEGIGMRFNQMCTKSTHGSKTASNDDKSTQSEGVSSCFNQMGGATSKSVKKPREDESAQFEGVSLCFDQMSPKNPKPTGESKEDKSAQSAGVGSHFNLAGEATSKSVEKSKEDKSEGASDIGSNLKKNSGTTSAPTGKTTKEKSAGAKAVGSHFDQMISPKGMPAEKIEEADQAHKEKQDEWKKADDDRLETEKTAKAFAVATEKKLVKEVSTEEVKIKEAAAETQGKELLEAEKAKEVQAKKEEEKRSMEEKRMLAEKKATEETQIKAAKRVKVQQVENERILAESRDERAKAAEDRIEEMNRLNEKRENDRVDAENAKQEEAKRLAEEKAMGERIVAEKKAAKDAQFREAERIKAQQAESEQILAENRAKRLKAEQDRIEEMNRVTEMKEKEGIETEKTRQEEAKRLAEEKTKDGLIAAENKTAEEAERLKTEQDTKEKIDRIFAEERAAEAARVKEVKRAIVKFFFVLAIIVFFCATMIVCVSFVVYEIGKK